MESKTQYSYSRLSTFASCPYRYFLQYCKGLKTIPDTNADNALWLGLGLHKGIEEWSVEAGIEEYKSHYNIIGDDNENWISQLEYQIPKVLELLPQDGENEIEVSSDGFIGYIDYICGDTLYDFKFTSEKNMDGYKESPQLSLYKYFLEKQHPEFHINHLKYICVPKVNIRQKKTETLFDFRNRLQENLEATEIRVIEVEYDPTAGEKFIASCKQLETVSNFPKNETKLCDWCNFKAYCKDGEDWMIL